MLTNILCILQLAKLDLIKLVHSMTEIRDVHLTQCSNARIGLISTAVSPT